MSNGIHEISHATRMLSQRIQKLAQGETLGYAEIDGIIGGGSRGGKRHIVGSARYIAEREAGVVCESVRGVGLRRLQADEIGRIGDTAVSRIRSTSRSACRKMRRAIEETPPSGDSLTLALSRVAVLGAIGEMTTQRRIDSAEKAAKVAGAPVSADAVLALFAKK